MDDARGSADDLLTPPPRAAGAASCATSPSATWPDPLDPSEALPLSSRTIVWLFRAYNAAMNELAASLRPLDLSPSAFHVLQTLAGTEGEELEPCQLAERLLVSRPSVTGLIDNLEAKSLVSRRRHPDDRRRVLVGLTDQARSLLRDHEPDHHACLRRVAGELSDDEMETLVALLRKIHGAMPPEARGSAQATATP